MMQTCRISGERFEIFERDQHYYAKIGMPLPTLSPLERVRRRMAFRNERHLYPDECDLCHKQMISMYSSEKSFTVYCQPCWWSDHWDAASFEQPYDSSKSFFEQYQKLQRVVPRIALLNINAENSEYCNFTGDVKNSYLVFGSVYSEDCFYGSPYYSKNCVDTLVVRECELCYECTDCRKLYNCKFCQDCTTSSDLLLCYDCQNCQECIGCSGLRGQKYHLFNQPVSKEEYLTFKKNINLCDSSQMDVIRQKFEHLKRTTPRKFMSSRQVENVSGDHVYNSKNTFHSFFADRCEDCSYCAQVVDMKDCYDCNYTEEGELCYEYLGMYANRNTHFSLFCRNTCDVSYCEYLVNVKNAFGCIGVRNADYVILNRPYDKKSYQAVRATIIESMKTSKDFGEFFPMTLSPYAFNETVANEYFPLTLEEVTARGGVWKKQDNREFAKQTVSVPANIGDVSDEIFQAILACQFCGKNYRIVAPELKFYRQMGLSIPRFCPNCRHIERVKLRNPRILFQRPCVKCSVIVESTYAPDRQESVYCEKCYLQSVY